MENTKVYLIMGKPNETSGFTTCHVRTDTSKKVKRLLNKLVSREKGVTVRGYDSMAFAVDFTIKNLSVKHPDIKADEV